MDQIKLRTKDQIRVRGSGLGLGFLDDEGSAKNRTRCTEKSLIMKGIEIERFIHFSP